MIKFLFDLDGTLTKKESLPLIAKYFNVDAFPNQMAELTRQSLVGNISFEESFTKRVSILQNIAVDEIAETLKNIPLFTSLEQFIKEHNKDCAIVTSNIKQWVEKLCLSIGCEYYTSCALVEDNKIIKITSILKKEEIVAKYQKNGYYVVFIGDAMNDLEALKQANCAIVAALIHKPTKGLVDVADYCIDKEENLYNLLNSIVKDKGQINKDIN